MVKENDSFKLTVAKSTTEGHYLIGNYHKTKLAEVEGLVGVIRAMGNFGTPVLKNEPTYRDLPSETQELIDTIRQVMVGRDENLLKHLIETSRTVRTVYDQLPPLRLKMSDEEIERILEEPKIKTDNSSQS